MKSVVLRFLNSQSNSQLCWKTQFKIENSNSASSFIMSTTRSQKRKNIQQENTKSISEGLVSLIVVGNSCFSDQDVSVARPSRPKSTRVENSFLECLRASLKEEITSEIRSLLIESQKEMVKLLKPKTGENMRENTDDETKNETRSFHTLTKSFRINFSSWLFSYTKLLPLLNGKIFACLDLERVEVLP